MLTKQPRQEMKIELSLFALCVALTVLVYCVEGFKIVVLNLFYLPVVLAAFYLGRQRAGVLCLVCVLLASVVAVWDLESYAASTSPLTIGLALITWGAVMGMNSIFVGTLSDERSQTINELHDAYVGVVEVLAQYLKSANTALNNRSRRVAMLAEKLAREMELTQREVDDIRVAALLQDVQNIEITAKVIHRAVGDLNAVPHEEHTFQGTDLVQSLGAVLSRALPLIAPENVNLEQQDVQLAESREIPFGRMILHTASRYDELVYGDSHPLCPQEAVSLLRSDLDAEHHPAVLHALDHVLARERHQNRDASIVATSA